MKPFPSVFFSVLLLTSIGVTVLAQSVPPLINYQGRLANPDGSPFPTGDYELSVRIWNADRSGTNIWGPQIFDGGIGQGHGPKIPFVQGYFNLMLGPVDTNGISILEAFAGPTRFIEVSINGRQAISPRSQILSTPFALTALSAGQLKGSGTAASNGIVVRADGNLLLNQYGGVVSIGSANGTGSGWIFDPQMPQRAAAIRTSWGYWMFGYVANRGPGHELISIGSGSPSPNQQSIEFLSGGAIRMKIETNGIVGIGYTHPSDSRYSLMVNGSACAAGSWVSCSDRAVKQDFAPVDTRSVLENLVRVPILTWAYTNSSDVRHIGPMAQDFQRAFAVGFDDKHVASVDADGVALASIQALYEVIKERDAAIASLRRDVDLLLRERVKPGE